MKRGRPKAEDPRRVQFNTRLSVGEDVQLRQAAGILGLSKNEVMVQGIAKMHAQAMGALIRRA